MLFDQCRFKNQGFRLVVCDNEFEVGDLAYERVRLTIKRTLLKVGAHPVAQVLCLANVDNLARGVFV